jgi:hypothetical protein
MQKRLRGGFVRVLWMGGMAGAMAALVGGCAAPKTSQPGVVIEADVARVIKLPDGSTCTEPSNLSALLAAPGGQLARRLMTTEEKLEDAIAKEKEGRFSNDEIEAAYFDLCRAYSREEIKKDAFARVRANYLSLRQVQLNQGIRDWTSRKDGIKEAGKLCMVVFGDTGNSRNYTRWVPPETTADDCAVFSSRAGGSEVLLGCTEGQWKNRWAKKPVAATATGARSRGLVVRDTPSAPEPNCGWL